MIPLSQAALDASAKRLGYGAPIVLVESTASTMHDARQLAGYGMPHGTLAVAKVQHAGRGRLQRVWASPRGSLAMTLVARPQLNLSQVGLVSLVTAVAIRQVLGPRFSIKWPNDVLGPDGRKVAGVLCELESTGRTVDVVLIGIGVNVHAAPASVPHAACVDDYAASEVRMSDLAVRLADAVVRGLQRAVREPGAVLSEWKEGASTIGQRVRVGGAEGVATGITTEGALILSTDDGAALIVHTGDVLQVAPEETDVAGPPGLN